MDNRKVFALTDVTRRIGDLLLEATRQRFWLRAQLVVGRRGVRAGHFYCELVQVDARGGQVAKLDAVIWRTTYEPLRRRLLALGVDEPFADNSEIVAECSLDYHEVHGLKLRIHDVDTTFGEAEIERNRREIVDRLRADELLERNKATRIPVPPLRIGLVTANGSAAHADFARTLEASGYAFEILLAPAVMQGARCEAEIVAAIDALERESADVICLIRGGGSQLDLASLDRERIARRIAESTRPVLVGLGHEIDFGVLDVVAHTSFKTPTAVAADLVARISVLEDRLAIAYDRLRSSTSRAGDLARLDLDRIREQFGRICARRIRSFGDALDRRASLLSRQRFETRLGTAEESLRSRERMLASLAPEAVLARGYAIVRDSTGGTVRRAANLSANEQIRLTFADGTASARVEGREPTDDER